MNYQSELKGFLDDKGKLTHLPAKHEKRKTALEMISDEFEKDKNYKEKEVNEIIKGIISFSDHETVRRELISAKMLNRTPDGAKYWRSQKE
jgi:hypothetical protein